MKPYFRTKDICNILRIKLPTLYAWIAQGKFPKGVQINKRIRVWTETDIEIFLSNQLGGK